LHGKALAAGKDQVVLLGKEDRLQALGQHDDHHSSARSFRLQGWSQKLGGGMVTQEEGLVLQSEAHRMCFRLPAGLEDLAGQLDASSEDLLLPAFSRWLRGWTLRLRCGQDIIVARREAPLVLQAPGIGLWRVLHAT